MPMPNLSLRSRWAFVSAMVVLVSTLAILSAVRSGRVVQSTRVAQLFGGEAGLAVVAHPDSIQAFRLDTTDDSRIDFPVADGPITVPNGIAKSLASALAADGSYDWGVAHGCMPRYGVRLSFNRGSDRVDVLFCMNCRVLSALRGGDETGSVEFGPIRPAMVDAFKSLFPRDPAIQSLSREGGKYVRGL